MRMIFGLVLAVGVALAGAAVFLAKSYISRTEVALQEERAIQEITGGLVEVFVVNKLKNYGEPLTKEDVVPMFWPKNSLPEAVFTDFAVLFPENEKENRFVLRQMEMFEPILAMKVTEPGEPAGLTGEIEKGMRAFAIQVEAADFLQTGDHVDIYWTGSVNGTEGDMTRLIESTMKIIAVDRNEQNAMSDGIIASRTMTVAATPEQVARLAQAQATGRVVMSLVGVGDDASTGLIEVDSAGLLGIIQTAPEVIAADRVCTIRTRKGADVTEIAIPCTN
jgi:pilus assembly protein CpaB